MKAGLEMVKETPMEKKSATLKVTSVPVKPQSPAPSAFAKIAADSRIQPKQYVKDFLAPGGGE